MTLVNVVNDERPRLTLRAQLGQAAALCACLAIAWTVLIFVSGGLRVQVGSFVISSRTVARPAIVAAILYAIAYAAASAGDRGLPWARLTRLSPRASALVAMAMALAVLVFSLTFGARTAGGSDALGYVSQAHLFVDGELRIEDRVSRSAPWPFAAESMAPLGFLPGRPRGTIVPMYSPGASLLMAGALKLTGSCGPFYVAPVCAFVLVLATWTLVQRLTDDALTSLMAAAFTAASPVLLTNAPLPMSDTIVAALAVTALVLLTAKSAVALAAAGFVTALTIAVRPNLAPLAGAFAVAVVLWGDPSKRLRRLWVFGLCAAPGPILVALVNDYLHGSPFRSGYGSFVHLYALSNIPGNVERYTRWLGESHGWLAVGLAAVPVLLSALRPGRIDHRKALPLVLFATILIASYLVYIQFDGWPFLRFFLPGLPLMFTLMAISAARFARLSPASLSVPCSAALVAYIIASSLWFAQRQGMFLIGPGEHRYAAVAEFVNRALPANAAIIGLQHTGSLAFYTARLTLRYDLLPPDRLGSVLDWLHANGYRPYVVLEAWEEPRYRAHFSGVDKVSRLEISPIVETSPGITVRVYDGLDPLDSSTLTVPPRVLDVNLAPECQPPAPRWTELLR
jgi:hypothetical protein